MLLLLRLSYGCGCVSLVYPLYYASIQQQCTGTKRTLSAYTYLAIAFVRRLSNYPHSFGENFVQGA